MLVYLYKQPTTVNCICLKYKCTNTCRLWHYTLKTIGGECYSMVVSVISQIMITHQLALPFVWLQIQFIYASWTE